MKHIDSVQKLKGKYVKTNLSVITRSMRDQNINLTFIVESVQESKGKTKLVKYGILDSFIKRFVRRDKSKVGDSFLTRDKKGNLLRIKPLIVTFNVATSAQKTKIRLTAREFIKDHMKRTDLDTFVSELMHNSFQRKLKAVLKKTMPVKHSEIRIVQYEKLNVVNILPNEVKVVDEEVVQELKKENSVAEETKVQKTKSEKKEEISEKQVEVSEDF